MRCPYFGPICGVGSKFTQSAHPGASFAWCLRSTATSTMHIWGKKLRVILHQRLLKASLHRQMWLMRCTLWTTPCSWWHAECCVASGPNFEAAGGSVVCYYLSNYLLQGQWASRYKHDLIALLSGSPPALLKNVFHRGEGRAWERGYDLKVKCRNTQKSAHHLASDPSLPFQVLSRSFGEKSELRDKIWNGEPGFEATQHPLWQTCKILHSFMRLWHIKWDLVKCPD